MKILVFLKNKDFYWLPGLLCIPFGIVMGFVEPTRSLQRPVLFYSVIVVSGFIGFVLLNVSIYLSNSRPSNLPHWLSISFGVVAELALLAVFPTLSLLFLGLGWFHPGVMLILVVVVSLVVLAAKLLPRLLQARRS